jgi:hypothetical protein
MLQWLRIQGMCSSSPQMLAAYATDLTGRHFHQDDRAAASLARSEPQRRNRCTYRAVPLQAKVAMPRRIRLVAFVAGRHAQDMGRSFDQHRVST